MSGWQPIETAPKDGTRFLIFARAQMDYEDLYGVASWFRPTFGDPFVLHHWADNIPCGNCSIEVPDPEPTHWMPLPEGPDVGGKRG